MLNIMSALIFQFNTDLEQYNTASHKFYTVRKRLYKEHGDDDIMKVTPSEFFRKRKESMSSSKDAEDSCNRIMGLPERDMNGDFDDIGNSKQANQYFGYNKHMRDRL